MDADEAEALAAALQEQLQEQREALQAVAEALEGEDAGNDELLQLQEQLQEAICEAESSLLEVKRLQLTQLVEGNVEESHAADADACPTAPAGDGAWQGRVEEEGSGSDGDGEDAEDDDGDDDEDEEYGVVRGAVREAADQAARAAAAGPQKLTVTHAGFEAHTRGIGSKLLLAMGWKGGGLGARQQGSCAPLEVVSGKAKAGLGTADAGGVQEGREKKKKNRGGERARRKKAAAAAAAAQSEGGGGQARQEEDLGMFGFLNRAGRSVGGDEPYASDAATASTPASDQGSHHHHHHQQQHASRGTALAGEAGGFGSSGRGGGDGSVTDRQRLVAQQDRAGALRATVQRLRGMASRQAGNPAVLAQVQHQLTAASSALAEAEGGLARSHKALHDREQQRKWAKF